MNWGSRYGRHMAIAVIVFGIAVGLYGMLPVVTAAPHLQVSPTPAPVVLPTFSPTPAQAITNTPTRTPTPVGPALAEALEGPTNIRAAPDINADRLGVIYPGEFYPVLGRAAGTLWLKIQHPEFGTAWVFEQVVNLTGDVDNIPEIAFANEPTVDVQGVVASQTIEALAQTPGALATATAEALFAGVIEEGVTFTPSPTMGPLPTFTFPPDSAGPQATVVIPPSRTAVPEGALPPIIPIIALAAIGGLGLLVGILRRIG